MTTSRGTERDLEADVESGLSLKHKLGESTPESLGSASPHARSATAGDAASASSPSHALRSSGKSRNNEASPSVQTEHEAALPVSPAHSLVTSTLPYVPPTASVSHVEARPSSLAANPPRLPLVPLRSSMESVDLNDPNNATSPSDSDIEEDNAPQPGTFFTPRGWLGIFPETGHDASVHENGITIEPAVKSIWEKAKEAMIALTATWGIMRFIRVGFHPANAHFPTMNMGNSTLADDSTDPASIPNYNLVIPDLGAPGLGDFNQQLGGFPYMWAATELTTLMVSNDDGVSFGALGKERLKNAASALGGALSYYYINQALGREEADICLEEKAAMDVLAPLVMRTLIVNPASTALAYAMLQAGKGKDAVVDAVKSRLASNKEANASKGKKYKNVGQSGGLELSLLGQDERLAHTYPEGNIEAAEAKAPDRGETPPLSPRYK